MDSFYDAPRRLPAPISFEKLPPVPVVPDISVLCPLRASTNQYTPYTAWRTQENRNVSHGNKENVPHIANQSNTSYLKKQVRFESPVLQQRAPLNCEAFGHKRPTENVSNSATNVKTFEQIYLANIPNRHLDLSLVEPNRVSRAQEEVHKVEECAKKEEKPKTYKEFCNLRQEDSITDVFNYKKQSNSKNSPLKANKTSPVSNNRERNRFDVHKNIQTFNDSRNFIQKNDNFNRPNSPLFSKNIINEPANMFGTKFVPQNNEKESQPSTEDVFQNILPRSTTNKFLHTSVQKCNNSTQTDLIKQEQTPNNDPTIKDLLKIISQQNEQLILLQKQVSTLLNKETNSPKRLEASSEKYVTSTQHEDYRKAALQDTPRKRMQKFSIDMMTSFEVSFRRQPQKNRDLFNHEPKIQEITETESCSQKSEDKNEDRTCVDASLCLQEPIRVREACPSPEPSIKIDMNDYESSESEEDLNSEIGTTFYNNLMGQVNKILKKAHIQTRVFDTPEPGKICEDTREQTMNKVKAATIKHLQSIGVNVPNMEGVSLDSGDGSSDSEISFAVKQLLMKYLPDEQLAKVIQKKQSEKKIGIIPKRPEFSFATVQYMKKYNLIASGSDNVAPHFQKLPQLKNDGPKILDISKLKQQPKLM